MPSMDMDWVFDDPERYITMSSCAHTRYDENLWNHDGRWQVSNIHWYWRNAAWWFDRPQHQWRAHGLDQRPARYAYPIGGFSAPSWWSGYAGNPHGMASLFDIIPKVVIEDARQRKCLLLLDNLNEGFLDPWLWQWLHAECDRLALPASCVVWLNSNLPEPAAYAQWAKHNQLQERLTVISFCHLMHQQRIAFGHTPAPTTTDHMAAKSTGPVKLFNCLNRVWRPHRQHLVLRLIEADLLRHGAVSHDSLRSHETYNDVSPRTIARAAAALPLVVDDADFSRNKAMMVSPEIYLNSWVSVITETHADDDVDHLFISEKIWKPIYCRHPFMVLGNPGTLQALQDMGYRADYFNAGAIDTMPYTQRLQHILDQLQQLHRCADRIEWYARLEDQLEHNHQMFMSSDFSRSAACDGIMRAYGELR